MIVSTPQDIVLIDAGRGVRMFETTRAPVLGLVENMSFFCCPACGHRAEIVGHGGARAEAQHLGTEFLGEVPLLLDSHTASDAGTADCRGGTGRRGGEGVCGDSRAGVVESVGRGGGTQQWAADRHRLKCPLYNLALPPQARHRPINGPEAIWRAETIRSQSSREQMSVRRHFTVRPQRNPKEDTPIT
jgi:predicted RNA-binding Zn-ribbon protein involved in translation (DUF1610 family)